LGVSYHKSNKKYRAGISVGGKHIGLGYFNNPEEAHQAYLDAKAKYHLFQPVPR
jgi:hypothetical protein